MSLVGRFGGVEPGVSERALELWSIGSPKSPAGQAEACIGCCDLTSLTGTETRSDIERLAASAARPDPEDTSIPHAAAVCIFPEWVSAAAEKLEASGVAVAAVAGDFPAGRAPLEQKVDEVRHAVTLGADEVDVVMDRRLLLAGDEAAAVEEIDRLVAAADGVPVKVILETGGLGSSDNIRRAALVALVGGATMIKSSTGKIAVGATPEAVLVMAEAVRGFLATEGGSRGLKVSGGIRTAAAAFGYAGVVTGVLGEAAMVPDRFRIGASALLGELVSVRRRAGRPA